VNTVLVTGGAGFIGRWVVSLMLERGASVLVLDDLSNGRVENLKGLDAHAGFLGLVRGDLKDAGLLRDLFAAHRFERVFHLGASIHVQASIDDPEPTFRNDAEGTFRVLEACRAEYFRKNGLDPKTKRFDHGKEIGKLTDRTPRVVVMSTCMVYDLAGAGAISESHAYRPASPYAAAKIASDMLALSYFHAYGMPVAVVRPFNTYGPFQKTNSEGGVVSIFLKRDIAGEPLQVKGSGEQTRDLLYVEDCAEFVVSAMDAEAAEGQIVNAGTGTDIPIKQLARAIKSPKNEVVHVPHDHPQAEIPKLLCDADKARRLLGWGPRVTLEDGLARTRKWLEENRWAW
jgi:nucleoside-diphosphate-sugar epimerase